MFHSNEYLYQNEKCAILYPQYRGYIHGSEIEEEV